MASSLGALTLPTTREQRNGTGKTLDEYVLRGRISDWMRPGVGSTDRPGHTKSVCFQRRGVDSALRGCLHFFPPASCTAWCQQVGEF